MVYNIKYPLVVLYEYIEYLEILVESADNPCISKQLIYFGIKVLKNTRELGDRI